MLGHKKGDPSCKAEAGTVHDSAPGRAKWKFNESFGKQNDGGPTGKKPDGLCRFFSQNGTCRFGANCKFKRSEGDKIQTKKVRFAKKDKKPVNALKAKVSKQINDLGHDEIEELVRGFLMIRIIPRERADTIFEEVTALNSFFGGRGSVCL
jgi:hypothetical protein